VEERQGNITTGGYMVINSRVVTRILKDDTIYKYVRRILRVKFLIAFRDVPQAVEMKCIIIALVYFITDKCYPLRSELRNLILIMFKVSKTKNYTEIKGEWSAAFNERHECPGCNRHGQLKYRTRTKDYRCDYCGEVFDV